MRPSACAGMRFAEKAPASAVEGTSNANTRTRAATQEPSRRAGIKRMVRVGFRVISGLVHGRPRFGYRVSLAKLQGPHKLAKSSSEAPDIRWDRLP